MADGIQRNKKYNTGMDSWKIGIIIAKIFPIILEFFLSF